MPNTDSIIARGQKRGISISENEDDTWHASYVWEGREFTLDNEDPQKLLDDMEALAEIFAQDDTYTLEYNEDLDRYILTVEGTDKTFTHQTLAKAFAEAKADVMDRMTKQEEARRPKPEPEAPKTRARKGAANGPAENAVPEAAMTVGRGSSTMPDLPLPVANAVVGLLNALSELLSMVASPAAAKPFKPAQPEEPFIEPAEPATPAPKKRGLGSSKK